MKRIITYNILTKVKVRKYSVDQKSLCEMLRNSKKLLGINNKQLSNILNVPITNVEHWFRQDKYFSIPEPDIWYQLKQALNIQTNEFDKSIMEFEIKDNVFEKGNRVYDELGICPTITVSDDIKVIIWM